jgi:hypothetical protein
MATKKVEVLVVTCDGCGKQFIQDVDDPETALGYYGDVMAHYESGGHGAEWFACQERCIRKAIVNSLERALD